MPARRHALLVLPVAAVLAALAACSGASAADISDTSDAMNKDTTLHFEVTADGGKVSNITYAGDGMSIAQENEVAAPWSKDVVYTKGTLGVNISAQNAGGGNVTCKITEGDKVISENTSSGEYAIAMCAVS